MAIHHSLPGPLFAPPPPDQPERRRVLFSLQHAGQVCQEERQIGIVAPVLASQQETFAEFVLRRQRVFLQGLRQAAEQRAAIRQVFEAPGQSQGVLRLRCTLLEGRAGGERPLAQRSFLVQRPSPSADAAGGVRALTAATDAAAREIAGWLQQR